MDVCCECCVLSGRGLCDELITRPEESYRLWCIVVFNLETSRMRRPWPVLGRSTTAIKKFINTTISYCLKIHLILSSHLRMGLPVGSFLQISPRKPCTRLFFSPYALHALPISFFFNMYAVKEIEFVDRNALCECESWVWGYIRWTSCHTVTGKSLVTRRETCCTSCFHCFYTILHVAHCSFRSWKPVIL